MLKKQLAQVGGGSSDRRGALARPIRRSTPATPPFAAAPATSTHQQIASPVARRVQEPGATLADASV